MSTTGRIREKSFNSKSMPAEEATLSLFTDHVVRKNNEKIIFGKKYNLIKRG